MTESALRLPLSANRETTLLKKKAGNTINIENDIIGKYVDRLLNFKDSSPSDGGGITMDFLRKYDF